jgi:hypothetical protein
MPSISVHSTGADPFLEQIGQRLVMEKQVLGGRFRFESDSHELLDLVEAAYAGLPEHRLSGADQEFRVQLRLVPGRTVSTCGEPPIVQTQSGAGVLCGIMDASNYVVMSPEQGRALVVASRDRLSTPYYVRYELIEFAVFTLATRGLGLVPLHGACVGRRGRGLLLLGESGSGKSTLALHSFLSGLELLSEDAVFVQPESMLATGVANYVHVKADAIRFVDDPLAQHWVNRAPVIRRRSGIEKHEADLRSGDGTLAATPLALVGAVFVSSQWADDPLVLLGKLSEEEIAKRLVANQPYASGQPGWQRFQCSMARLGVYELRRGRHPQASVEALQKLLE